jgi:hypothetical protein
VSEPARKTNSSERDVQTGQGESLLSDVGLLLRAHAEHGWLSREVLPVVCQVEEPAELSRTQFHAARAYLEVVWEEALVHARNTDASRERVRAFTDAPELCEWACRYHAAVRELRERLAARVAALLTAAPASR